MSSQVGLVQQEGYRFSIRFAPEVPPLVSDEPAPLGQGAGPSPVQLLAASVGNCLAASLVFALRKFRQSAEPVSAEAEAFTGRNEHNRLRVQRIKVRLKLNARADSLPQLQRVLQQFEDFCTVTQSVRQAIAVEVEVQDADGLPVVASGALKEPLA